MSLLRVLPAVICGLVLALAGCGSEPEAPSAPASRPAAKAPATTAAPAVAATIAEPATEGSKAVPRLRVTTVSGTTYDLRDQRGKWVVVNFWATWCSPCLKEMPELSALDALREHVEVIGLAYEDIERADMLAFLKEHPVVYPIAIVDTYDPPADFDTPRGLPMTYLIAPDGKVAKKVLGPVTAHDLEQAIAAAGGPKVSP